MANGKNKVKLSLCLTNEALRHEGVWGSGCIDPHFDLGSTYSCGCSVNSMIIHQPKFTILTVTSILGGN
jgi:hypothetical protein